MPRNGSGVYSLPAGYEATTGQTATAAQHNDPLEDVRDDLNAARPVVAGGTGATSASAARTNLGLGSLSDDGIATSVPFTDVTDDTIELAFDISGNTTGTTRTWAFPDEDGTVVGRTTTQTITNKTVSGPQVTIDATSDRDLILKDGNINWGTVGQDYIDFLNNGGLRVYEDGVFKARIGTGDTTLILSVYDNTTASVANINVNSFGAIRQSTSSGEYKINRAPVDGNVILALEPVSFESTHTGDADLPRMAGFIAEDVAAAFPEATVDGGKNYDVRAIVAALVALAQRQERRIRALEAGV